MPWPKISNLAALVHDRSILGTFETWSRLGGLYAINAPLSPLIRYVTRNVDLFHISNQIQEDARAARTPVTATLPRYDLLDHAGTPYARKRAS